MNLIDKIKSENQNKLSRISGPCLLSGTTTYAKIKGKEYLQFGSNDYLGYSDSPELKIALTETAVRYGIGASGTRGNTGNLEIHLEAERELSRLLNAEDTVLMSSGLSAITSVIFMVSSLGKDVKIFTDEKSYLNITGLKAAFYKTIKIETYKHNEPEDLDCKLNKKDLNVVITDGIFSSTGNISMLKGILEVCKNNNALMVIDDAHGIGALGDRGAGSTELSGINLSKESNIVLIGTASKAMGVSGGFITANKDVIQLLRGSLWYNYSTAPMPAVSAAIAASIKLIKKDKQLREKLLMKSKKIREELQKKNIKIFGEAHVLAVIVPESEALRLIKGLFDKGIICSGFNFGKEYNLRISPTALHSEEDINKLVNAF